MTGKWVRRCARWLVLGAAIAVVAAVHAPLGAVLLAVFALSASDGGRASRR